MLPPTAYSFDRQRILVADEDSVTAARIIAALRRDGHCVTHDPTALSAPDLLAFTTCHLMISSMRVDGRLRMDLLQELRGRLPTLAVVYLSDETSPTLDPQLVDALVVLGAPFTMSELQAAVGQLLPQLRAGTVLARPSGETAPASDELNSVTREATRRESGR